MAKTPEFEQAKEFCLNRLKNELSPLLIYHSQEHTVNDVVTAAERLASLEKVNHDDRVLLLTAAYYHDLGFIRLRQGHEAVSIELAEQILPQFGYSDEQIGAIRGIIQATCIPQSPTNLLERIMADADLDYLGGDNFWDKAKELRLELENFGEKFTDKDWYIYQLRFIQSHQYFTASERSLRDGIKQRHFLEIQQLLDEATVLRRY